MFTASVNLAAWSYVEIIFAKRKLGASMASHEARVRAFGAERANKLNTRLTQLYEVERLEDMRGLPGRCHELRGDRQGQLAVDVTKNYRLIFKPTEQPPPQKDDGGLGWSKVEAITILEVEDYHGE
jgi:proteic killer suppression protein